MENLTWNQFLNFHGLLRFQNYFNKFKAYSDFNLAVFGGDLTEIKAYLDSNLENIYCSVGYQSLPIFKLGIVTVEWGKYHPQHSMIWIFIQKSLGKKSRKIQFNFKIDFFFNFFLFNFAYNWII